MNGPTPPSATNSTVIAPASPATSSEGKPRVRRQWSYEEKAEHLALFAESGFTQAEYCAEMGLSPATFSLWFRQSRAPGVVPDEAATERVIVHLRGTRSRRSNRSPSRVLPGV